MSTQPPAPGPSTDAALRAALGRRLGEAKRGLWFGDGVGLTLSGGLLDVAVPNSFFREWIRSHYTRALAEAAREVAGRPVEVAIRIGSADHETNAEAATSVAGPSPAPTAPELAVDIAPAKPQVAPSSRGRASGRPARRLDEFVVGACNRMAHAAAIETATAPGTAFNPLVIHGGIGLGKTHLLEGIGAGLRARQPGLKVVQLTAEAFTNGFLDAMRNGGLGSFRQRYRSLDVLLVDDVHFLAAKRATQDEFLHTFNALMGEGATIVLTMDQHPRQVSRLTDELATRFVAGMVVKLEAPDPATRRAIVRAKAAARGVELPESVSDYIAEHLRASVRDLEGALHSVLAHASLAGRRIDLNLAKSALRDTIRHTAQAVALRDVEKAVCRLFQVDPEALKSEGRARAVSQPRMIAMYLARKHTGAAYSEIGRFFGGRNHSTVISAEKKVTAWLVESGRQNVLAGFETIADVVANLEQSLGTT